MMHERGDLANMIGASRSGTIRDAAEHSGVVDVPRFERGFRRKTNDIGAASLTLLQLYQQAGDLGLEFGPAEWTAGYVDTELPRSLAGLPARLSLDDRRTLLAWLMGRAGDPPPLPPW